MRYPCSLLSAPQCLTLVSGGEHGGAGGDLPGVTGPAVLPTECHMFSCLIVGFTPVSGGENGGTGGTDGFGRVGSRCRKPKP